MPFIFLQLASKANDLNINLTVFDIGGHDDPQNVFGHCAQTLRKRKLKLGDF